MNLSRKSLVASTAAILVVLLLGWFMLCQSDSSVIHTSPATEVDGGAVIRVVAVKRGWGIMQRLTTVVDPLFYRCEYLRSADEPMWSSYSFRLESNTVQRVAVRWHSRDEASVYIDGRLAFHCRNREWSPAR
jgi:hypothetical protein